MAERKPARKVASKKAPVKKAARPEKKEKGNRYQFVRPFKVYFHI